MKIENLNQTCSACPSQWEFKTDGDRCCYVRYRWGYLSVCVSEPGGSVKDAVGGVEIFGRHLGDEFDGVLDWSVVLGFIEDIDVDNTLASLKNNVSKEEKGDL